MLPTTSEKRYWLCDIQEASVIFHSALWGGKFIKI